MPIDRTSSRNNRTSSRRKLAKAADLDADELAEELGVKPGALYTRLSRLRRTFEEVAEMAGRHGINLRIGAYMLAIQRVATVHRLRGMYA